MNSSRSARKYRTARLNRTKRGPLRRCRQARSVAMDNPRCCAASVSVKAFRDRNSPLASTRFRVILIGDLPAQRRAHKNTRCCSGDFARARRPYWPARSVSRADEGAVPTSGRRSCAPSGVGDDSGIVLPPNTSDIADSDLGSRVVRTLPSANAGHWDGRSPGPTVFHVKFGVRGFTPSSRSFCQQCARSKITDRRSIARSACGGREAEGVL
jgi:hypothetical protein